MALIRIGEKGINLAHVVRWASREEDAGVDDGGGGQLPGGRTYPFIWIEYVNGKSDSFINDEAVALRRELEQQSSDIMQSPSGGIYP